MKTYWAINMNEKYNHLSDVIKRLYLQDASFPFQVKQFRFNSGVVVLPNGKHIAKAFFNFA